jgi:ferritin-like metal-binding protein YciE
MSETPNRDAKLVQLLNEAYTKEKQLETALTAHIEVTTRKDYSKRLKDHLKETKSHATQVSRRIKQLGGTPETVSLPGPDGLTSAAERVSEVVVKAKAAAQGPLHTVRGEGEQGKMLHNARTQYEEEAYEIATYTVIESLASAVGDKQTAKVARDIKRQEERMQEYLAGLLPELSVDVAHDEIPVSEIEGRASHRTTTESKRKSPSSSKRKSSSLSRGGPAPVGDRSEPMAQEVQIAGTASTAKVRNPLGVVGLSLITLGIYYIFWWYFINREMRDLGRARNTDLGENPGNSVLAITLGALIIVPAIVTLWTTSGRIERSQETVGMANRASGPVVFILLLLIGPVGLWYAQHELNKVWAAQGESASPSLTAPEQPAAAPTEQAPTEPAPTEPEAPRQPE